MHFLLDNCVFYSTITLLLLLLLLLSLQACEVGFAVDVVQQELSGGCPTSREPCE